MKNETDSPTFDTSLINNFYQQDDEAVHAMKNYGFVEECINNQEDTDGNPYGLYVIRRIKDKALFATVIPEGPIEEDLYDPFAIFQGESTTFEPVAKKERVIIENYYDFK